MNRRTFLASLVAAAGLGMAKATGLTEPLEPNAWRGPYTHGRVVTFDAAQARGQSIVEAVFEQPREEVVVWDFWAKKPDGTYSHTQTIAPRSGSWSS